MSTAKGREAEDKAARYLQRHGYDIIARNVRGGRGELDIVARKGDILAFVEVKAHKHRDSSLEAVHTEKCARLRSAALAWLAKHPNDMSLQCRFDLIILTPKRGLSFLPPALEHLEDVFR